MVKLRPFASLDALKRPVRVRPPSIGELEGNRRECRDFEHRGFASLVCLMLDGAGAQPAPRDDEEFTVAMEALLEQCRQVRDGSEAARSPAEIIESVERALDSVFVRPALPIIPAEVTPEGDFSGLGELRGGYAHVREENGDDVPIAPPAAEARSRAAEAGATRGPGAWLLSEPRSGHYGEYAVRPIVPLAGFSRRAPWISRHRSSVAFFPSSSACF